HTRALLYLFLLECHRAPRHLHSFPTRRSSDLENIADRAVGYGIPGIVIDGQDVVAVYDAVSKAVDRARSGGGPTFVEAKTYRLRDRKSTRLNSVTVRSRMPSSA